jgi:pimeloyl-ACP methyl ester carboxylesterase
MARGRPRALFAKEGPRAAGEFASFLMARRRLGRGGPRGDGRPIMVMPGFIGSDGSTLALRRLLRRFGFHVHAWRLGRNLGPTDRVIDGLQERVQHLLVEHDQPLTLIGHSLGGIYAREIARAAPDAIRHVITLGSPVRRPTRVAEGGEDAPFWSAVAPLFQALTPLHSERAKNAPDDRIKEPIPVPLTAIITRTDGVVPWRICVPDAAPRSETIVVRGSHSGLIHNSAAIGVILDRLTLDVWRPFEETAEVPGASLWSDDLASSG